jgi:hypothetical protein
MALIAACPTAAQAAAPEAEPALVAKERPTPETVATPAALPTAF